SGCGCEASRPWPPAWIRAAATLAGASPFVGSRRRLGPRRTPSTRFRRTDTRSLRGVGDRATRRRPVGPVIQFWDTTGYIGGWGDYCDVAQFSAAWVRGSRAAYERAGGACVAGPREDRAAHGAPAQGA